MVKCSINTSEAISKFSEIDYKQLTDVFKDAIAKSIEILKSATESEIRSSSVNTTAPARKGKTTYKPMADGVVSELGVDGTKGRVRIAAANLEGYEYGGQSSFVLKWFEQGTSERFKKGKGYTTKKTKSGNSTRKHRNKGASTGSIKAYHWFENAYNASISEVKTTLEENINKAIQTIWNS